MPTSSSSSTPAPSSSAADQRALAAWLKKHDKEVQHLDNGKIRCTITGIDLVKRLPVLEAYWASGAYRRAVAAAQSPALDLSVFPHFIDHKHLPNKVFCTLTRCSLNRTLSEIQHHVAGKRYIAEIRRYTQRQQEKEERERKRKERAEKRAKCKEGDIFSRLPDAVLEEEEEEEEQEEEQDEEEVEDEGSRRIVEEKRIENDDGMLMITKRRVAVKRMNGHTTTREERDEDEDEEEDEDYIEEQSDDDDHEEEEEDKQDADDYDDDEDGQILLPSSPAKRSKTSSNGASANPIPPNGHKFTATATKANGRQRDKSRAPPPNGHHAAHYNGLAGRKRKGVAKQR